MERWEQALDRWLTTPPEPSVYSTCDYCGCDIYKGEDYVKVDGEENVHKDCFMDFAWERLNASTETADSRQDYED